MSEVRVFFVVLGDYLRASSRANREVAVLVFAMIFGLVISAEDLSLAAIATGAAAAALFAVVGILLLPAALFLQRSVARAKERREPLASYIGSPSYRESLASSLRF